MSMTNMDAAQRVERDIEESLPDVANLAQDRDPDRDNFIDEKTALELEKRASEEAEAGEFDVAGAWDSLTDEQREAMLNSGEMGRTALVSPRSPRWIDQSKVPASLHLRWISTVSGLGPRGYRPVLRKPETCEWVPNAPKYGAGKTFVVGTSVLCAIPKKEWLSRVAAEWRATNVDAFERYGEPFRAAINVLAKRQGLTAAQAKKLDREGVSGFTMTRRPDPHGKPDMVDAEEVAKARETQAVHRPGRRPRG